MGRGASYGCKLPYTVDGVRDLRFRVCPMNKNTELTEVVSGQARASSTIDQKR